MNNDIQELITSVASMAKMIDTLNQKIDNVQEDLTGVKQDLNIVKQDIKDNTGSLSVLTDKVTKIEITIENETNKNIQLLVEGYTGVTEKTEGLPETLEELKTDVSVIKDVVTGHSGEINKLAKVK